MSNAVRFIVNADRDAGMDKSHPYGKTVTLIKITKGGMYQVQDEEGKVYSLPKFNLDEEK